MCCFSLQVFLLFQLYCGFVLPIANAAPTHRNGRAEPQLLLNEVALNYGLHSFIELYAPNGLAGNLFNRHFFGLIIIKPTPNKQKNYITSIIDLKDLRQLNPQMQSGTKHIVIGKPTVESLQHSGNNYVPIPIVGDVTKMKIFGGDDQNWLNMGAKEIRMIILTRSRTGPILSQLRWNPAQQVTWAFLEDQLDLIEYIGRHQVDSIIVRGYSGPRKKCTIITQYVYSDYNKEGRLIPFLTVNPIATVNGASNSEGVTTTTVPTADRVTGEQLNTQENKKSISKCGHSDEAYSHKQYKYANLTPGRSNVEECNGGQWILEIEDRLDRVTDMQPSTTSFEGTCSIDEDDFDRVTGEQFNVQDQQNTIGTVNVATDNSERIDGEQLNVQHQQNAIGTANVAAVGSPPRPSQVLVGLVCPQCREVIHGVDALKSHLLQVHGIGASEANPVSVVPATPVCHSRAKVSHKRSETDNENHRNNVKRMKYMETLTDSCPNEDHPTDMLPFERERKLHTASAISFIYKNLRDKFTNLRDIETYAVDWFQLIIDYDEPEQSTFNCYFCSKYSVPYKIRNNSPLARKDGIMDAKDRNHRLLRDHGNQAAHKDVVQKYYTNYKRRMTKILETDLARLEPAEFEITNNHMRSVFYLVNQGYSFLGFKGLIEMQERHQGKMGQFCRSADSAKKMAKSISSVILEDLKASLLLANSALSLTVDGVYFCMIFVLYNLALTIRYFSGSSDVSGSHYVSVIIQYVGMLVKI